MLKIFLFERIIDRVELLSASSVARKKVFDFFDTFLMKEKTKTGFSEPKVGFTPSSLPPALDWFVYLIQIHVLDE